MPDSETKGGLKVTSASNEHRNGQTGKLISAGHTRKKWWLYFFGNWDSWRTNYCEHHRDDKLPESFRRGNLTLASMVVTLCLKVIEKCS